MAAIIKPIEAKSVHQIQSGQVIVDLCSVVKELIENGLDANATALEVRFKNHGLDAIEVQDNGSGIAAANYESVALKHYTSKLSTYDDLSSLETFGFRGEALSSLCALSKFSITTAQAHESPKGNQLTFETSGKLRSATVVATQKGTTAVVENIFEPLPVRRRELQKNIKREYGKVLGLLHAYACISINVKFTVKNAMPKGKSMIVFSTRGNPTIRDNIANVYGAKTLSHLIDLNLTLDFQSSPSQTGHDHSQVSTVQVQGQISRPVFGEGRQTPDRQMLFVNGRPCGLPQISKAINEVYKSFNVSQSPFVCADLRLDTNAYDVNVSPDKRTVFLHNAAALTENMKVALTRLFDDTEQTIPQASASVSRLPSYRQLSIRTEDSSDGPNSEHASISRNSSINVVVAAESDNEGATESFELQQSPPNAMRAFFRNVTSTRSEEAVAKSHTADSKSRRHFAHQNTSATEESGEDSRASNRTLDDNLSDDSEEEDRVVPGPQHVHIRDFNARIAEQQGRGVTRHRTAQHAYTSGSNIVENSCVTQPDPQNGSGVVEEAFSRMRPRRVPAEMATITIGDKTITRLVGTQTSEVSKSPARDRGAVTVENKSSRKNASVARFSHKLRKFGGPGTQASAEEESEDGEIEEEDVDGHHAGENDNGSPDEGEAYSHSSEPDSTQRDWQETARDDTVLSSDHSSEPGDLHKLTDDEEARTKAEEELRVAELIRDAEATARSEMNIQRRLTAALKGSQTKDSTTSLATTVNLDLFNIRQTAKIVRTMTDLTSSAMHHQNQRNINDSEPPRPEEQQLSLTVCKSDFYDMHIVGQFNLGFILAVRHKEADVNQSPSTRRQDELFIIDQHASDEKYNFERLQAETVVGNQRLVQPITLDLTAVEEEIVLENGLALEKNGFLINMDVSGDKMVGQRCQLVSLPLSKEVVFNTRDLDELIHLIAETPMISDATNVPRPSKVRKMFAMRACRSSIMIGKTLSHRQMSSVLHNLGGIDKPWNCPHGRPTMRHLLSLDVLNEELWEEGDRVGSTGFDRRLIDSAVWNSYAK